MLLQLEASDILRRRGVGSAPKERGEAPDMTNVILLRMRPQAPHQHVVLHALPQRRDRSVGRQGSHGEFLSLKGTPWSDRSLYPLKANACRATSERGALPRSGFVHGAASGQAASGVRMPEADVRIDTRFVAI